MHKAAYEKLLKEILIQVVDNSSFNESKKYIQHGNTSIYRHSIMVARKSCQIASKFNIKVSYNEMVRGALLHDYFLYDWHDKEHKHRRPHGFFHPSAALKNAMRDFVLTDIVKESTELIYMGSNASDLITAAFNCEPEDTSFFLPGVVSRKKQLIPAIMAAMQQ